MSFIAEARVGPPKVISANVWVPDQVLAKCQTEFPTKLSISRLDFWEKRPALSHAGLEET